MRGTRNDVLHPFAMLLQKLRTFCVFGLKVVLTSKAYLDWYLDGDEGTMPSSSVDVLGWQYASSVAGPGRPELLMSLDGNKWSSMSLFAGSPGELFMGQAGRL